ncbi:hypothetical protein [Aeromicrobium endophyticum]|nr:hypothetical protein [Aeromicrobium endophyticum]
MTVLIVCGCAVALIAFVVLVAALRSGASDPGFTIESTQSRPDDDENRAA